MKTKNTPWNHSAGKEKQTRLQHHRINNRVKNIISSMWTFSKIGINSETFKNKDVVYIWAQDSEVEFMIWSSAKTIKIIPTSNFRWIGESTTKQIDLEMKQSKDIVVINHAISNSQRPMDDINKAFSLLKQWWKVIIVDNYDWDSDQSVFTQLHKHLWHETKQIDDKIYLII